MSRIEGDALFESVDGEGDLFFLDIDVALLVVLVRLGGAGIRGRRRFAGGGGGSAVGGCGLFTNPLGRTVRTTWGPTVGALAPGPVSSALVVIGRPLRRAGVAAKTVVFVVEGSAKVDRFIVGLWFNSSPSGGAGGLSSRGRLRNRRCGKRG